MLMENLYNLSYLLHCRGKCNIFTKDYHKMHNTQQSNSDGAYRFFLGTGMFGLSLW